MAILRALTYGQFGMNDQILNKEKINLRMGTLWIAKDHNMATNETFLRL